MILSVVDGSFEVVLTPRGHCRRTSFGAESGSFGAEGGSSIDEADAGASPQDVLSTRVSVASSDRNDLVTARDAVRETFGEHDVPSTLVGVTVLGYEDQLVEIEAVAAVVG